MDAYKYKAMFDNNEWVILEGYSDLTEIWKEIQENEFICFLNCIIKCDSIVYIVDYDCEEDKCLF